MAPRPPAFSRAAAVLIYSFLQQLWTAAAPDPQTHEALTLASDSSRHCRPAPGVAWLLGSSHKTGTKLTEKILEQVLSDNQASGGNLNYLECRQERTADTCLQDVLTQSPCHSCMMAAMVMATHLHVSPASWSQMQAQASDRGMELRALAMIRDPLEVVLSLSLIHI